MSLRKFLAPEFIFGSGARKLVAQYAQNLSLSKVMVVTDPGVLAAGWPVQACDLLQAAGINTVLYSNVTPNPKDSEVMQGAALFCQEGCSGTVAIGGGSSIDCAKGIGIVASNKGSILDYVGIDRIPMPSPPLICIPTTGAAADVSQFAIITDTQNRNKVSIISRALVPDISLLDPDTTATMPWEVRAQSGIDALSQAIESLISNANAAITDLLALEAVKLLAENLPKTLQNPQSVEHRSGMLLGSLYSGLTLSNASLGLAHAMSHPLGGLLNLPHGECIGLLLLPIIRYNYPAAKEDFARIATAMGLDITGRTPDKQLACLIEALQGILLTCGFHKCLSELGLKPEDIPALAQKAIQDPCIVTNPRPATKEEVERLYGEAF